MKGRIRFLLPLSILCAILLLLWKVSEDVNSGSLKLSGNIKLEGTLISSSGFMFSQNDSNTFIFYLDHQEIGVVNFSSVSSSLDDFSQNELLCRWNFEVEWQGILKENRTYSYLADFEKKIARIETGDSLFVRAILPNKFLVSLKTKTENRKRLDLFLSNMKFQAIPVDSLKIQ
jgi:hypothetical protein